MKIRTWLKAALFGATRQPRRIYLGLYRGLVLWIDPSSEMLFYLGIYERETYWWLIKEGSQAQSGIDVGAGHGELTLWLLQQPKMRNVYAFEPDRSRWPIFNANLAANPQKPEIHLKLSQGFFQKREAIKIIEEAPEPILLKIDIDGGELSLLQELNEQIKGKDIRFLLEVHSEDLNKGCKALLEEAGYRVTQISKAWWRKIIPEQRPSLFNQWLVAKREW